MSEIARKAFSTFAANCPYRRELPVERRPGNVICLEVATPMPRCILKRPDHWPESATALRWIGSGGSPLVFGLCSQACALGRRWCQACGHFTDVHDCVHPGCNVWNCLCEQGANG